MSKEILGLIAIVSSILFCFICLAIAWFFERRANKKWAKEVVDKAFKK